MISVAELIYKDKVSICVYTGTEGDVFHRIINHHIGFDFVTFSLHDITIKNDVNEEEFFTPESQWKEEEPWKTILEELERKSHLPKEIADREVLSIFDLWKPYEDRMIVYNVEEHKCYMFYEDKKNKGKMMRGYNYHNSILYKYVDWNFLQGKIKATSRQFYPLSESKASRKIWILVRGYGKNGIWR